MCYQQTQDHVFSSFIKDKFKPSHSCSSIKHRDLLGSENRQIQGKYVKKRKEFVFLACVQARAFQSCLLTPFLSTLCSFLSLFFLLPLPLSHLDAVCCHSDMGQCVLDVRLYSISANVALGGKVVACFPAT